MELGQLVYDILQFAGILAFAISGALVGVRRRLDLLGVLVVGAATGVGGGILRDMLLGVNPPTSLVYWPNLAVALGGAVIVFCWHPKLQRLHRAEIIYDAFGLGLFSANGAAWAALSGYSILTAVIVGTITAIGGGVLRDILVNTVPGVLKQELYAVSAVSGASVAAGLAVITGSLVLASVIGGVVAVCLRLISYSRGWHLPRPGRVS